MPGGSDLTIALDVLASLRNRIVNPPAMRKFALKTVGVPDARGPAVAPLLFTVALLAAVVERPATEVAFAFGVPGRTVAAGVINCDCDPAADEPDGAREAGTSVTLSFCEKSGRMVICVYK